MAITRKLVPVLIAGVFGALALIGAFIGGFADATGGVSAVCGIVFVGCLTGGYFAFREYRGLDSGTLDSALPTLKSDKQRKRYFKSVVRHSLNPEEVPQDVLQKLKDKSVQIGLDFTDASAIMSEYAKEAFEQKLARTVSDNSEISDQDEEVFKAYAQSIGTGFFVPDSVHELYEHGRSLWRSKYAPLSVVVTALNLPPDELCYFESPCEWYEIRVEKIRIDRGKYVSREVWKALSGGMVYFTNKRVIFQGDNAFNRTLPAKKILDFHAQKEGIYLSKETGKAPMLKMKDADIATAIISRIIRGEIEREKQSSSPTG